MSSRIRNSLESWRSTVFLYPRVKRWSLCKVWGAPYQHVRVYTRIKNEAIMKLVHKVVGVDSLKRRPGKPEVNKATLHSTIPIEIPV